MATKKHLTRVLNCLPSMKVEQDWQVGNAHGAGLLAAAPPPATVDLRIKGARLDIFCEAHVENKTTETQLKSRTLGK